LRRLFTIHPEVRKIFHESFFLSKHKNARSLSTYVKHHYINPKKDIWGEKCPFYPDIKKIKPETYCRKLHSWYPKKFRVIHIIRHPIDVANSNIKKFDYIRDINQPLRMYRKIIPRIVSELTESYVLHIKYEYLLLEPDLVIPKIFSFCNLTPDIDYKRRLKKIENPNYQKINSSRAFAFLKEEQNINMNFDKSFKLLDRVGGPKY